MSPSENGAANEAPCFRHRTKGWRALAGPTLSVVVLVATFGLLEAGSYLFGRLEGPLQLYGQPDRDLFWSLRPGARDANGERWINDDGLRGPPIGPKQQGEFRILSLGESTTFAAQMPAAQSYSAVLEVLLQEGRPPGRVKVLNAGVPGYSLFQGVSYLKHRARVLQPDMVLLYFGYNDFLPVAFLATRAGDDAHTDGLNDSQLYDRRQGLLFRSQALLARHSNLYRGLSGLAAGARPRIVRQKGRPRVPPRHRLESLALATQLSQQLGAELVLVVPVYREFGLHEGLLRNFAAATGIAVVDLPGLLRARLDTDPDEYFLDAIHPAPSAHRLIAESIRSVVDSRVPQ